MKLSILLMALFASTALEAESGFSWLLNDSLKDSNEFAWDKRWSEVLRQIVPAMKVEKNAAPDLPGLVRQDIMLPEPKKVTGGRYVTFTGARPHDATTRGMVWIDAKDGVGAFALNECPSKRKVSGCVTVGSKNFAAKGLPPQFVAELKDWLDSGDSAAPMVFIDSQGKESKFLIPAR